MRKTAKTETPEVAARTAPVEKVTLTEFCIRLSAADKRVELIGAFQSVEQRAGRVKDSESAYRARYVAFINKPV